MTERTASRLLLAVVIACSVGITLAVVTPAIAMDDPFIGLRYVANLLAGHGLVYNPGEYVEGYTGFGWMMVAALGMALGFEPLAFWQVCGVISQCITLWLLWLLGARAGRSALVAVIAPALLGVHVAFVAYPMMGMETTFFTMLVTWGFYLIVRRSWERRGGALLLGSVLLAACLTRFDGVGIVGLLLLPVLFEQVAVRRDVRPVVPIVAVLALGLAAYNAWRLWYYGDLLPNTFHAKVTETGHTLQLGAAYLKDFVKRGGPFALIAVLLPIALLVPAAARRTMLLAALVASAHLAYVLVVGGDWMQYFRFVLPVLPLLCLLVQESLWAVWSAAAAAPAAAGQPRPAAGLRTAALLAVVAVVLVVDFIPLRNSGYVRNPGFPNDGPFFAHADAKRIGEHLNERLPPDALVALEWAGILAFYMQQPVFDIFGLSDREITSGKFPGGRMGRAITPEFLKEHRPDIVIYCGRIFATLEEAKRGTAVRGAEDIWINQFYRGLAADEYFDNCVIKIGDDGYWPVLIRRTFPHLAELCYAKIEND